MTCLIMLQIVSGGLLHTAHPQTILFISGAKLSMYDTHAPRRWHSITSQDRSSASAADPSSIHLSRARVLLSAAAAQFPAS